MWCTNNVPRTKGTPPRRSLPSAIDSSTRRIILVERLQQTALKNSEDITSSSSSTAAGQLVLVEEEKKSWSAPTLSKDASKTEEKPGTKQQHQSRRRTLWCSEVLQIQESNKNFLLFLWYWITTNTTSTAAGADMKRELHFWWAALRKKEQYWSNLKLLYFSLTSSFSSHQYITCSSSIL